MLRLDGTFDRLLNISNSYFILYFFNLFFCNDITYSGPLLCPAGIYVDVCLRNNSESSYCVHESLAPEIYVPDDLTNWQH